MNDTPRTAAAHPDGFLPAVFVVLVLSLMAAVFLGVVDIAPRDVIETLAGRGSPEARAIILDIRLPRIVTGALAGLHFALAGHILQTITRNPLADPSLMGVSQGATLAVTVLLVFAVYSHDPGSNTLAELPVAWMPLAGMAGGLAAGGLVYGMAWWADLGPLRITLCGIAIGSVLHALAIGLIAGWGSQRVEVLLEWLSGSLYARSWTHAAFLAPETLAGLAVLPVLRRPLDLLRLEPNLARAYGLGYVGHFSAALALAAVLAASAVGVVGPIVFVGLMVPHLARFAAGRRTSLVLPLTLAFGVIVVTLCDLAGRLLGRAEEIPIGVITILCGVPVLVALLRRIR